MKFLFITFLLPLRTIVCKPVTNIHGKYILLTNTTLVITIRSIPVQNISHIVFQEDILYNVCTEVLNVHNVRLVQVVLRQLVSSYQSVFRPRGVCFYMDSSLTIIVNEVI